MKNKLKFFFLAAGIAILSPGVAFAGAPAGPPCDTCFANPLDIYTVEDLVTSILTNLNGLIAFIAVLFIVIGGIMYILAAGDEKKITAAKSTITAAVIGFAITIGAGTFLREIGEILGYTSNNPTVSGATRLVVIIERTLNLLLSIIGIIAIIGIVIGGIYYLTAYGDEKRAETGKKIVTASIVGIAIALAALMIIRTVFSLIA